MTIPCLRVTDIRVSGEVLRLRGSSLTGTPRKVGIVSLRVPKAPPIEGDSGRKDDLCDESLRPEESRHDVRRVSPL